MRGGKRSTSFKPGQSGNPKGRPKESDDVKEAARAYTAEAIDRLVYWMRSDNAKASVAAITTLLNRGWGSPTQSVEVSGKLTLEQLVGASGLKTS